MTKYIILRLADDTSWKGFTGEVEASSAVRALKSVDLEAGEYVAIPARSFRPLTVTVEQTTKVTIG